MTSPTEGVCPPNSAGIEDGGAPIPLVAVLDLPVEWMRFCDVCDAVTPCKAELECASGLLAVCQFCGAERVARFTRTNSEVA
jgi:hypothetical protein